LESDVQEKDENTMTRNRVLFVGLGAILALLVAACGAAGPDSGNNATTGGLAKNADGYADISVEQLAEMLEDKDFALVNVHIPFEGDLPRTDLSIPFDEITDHLDQLPDKDAPIVLYCRSGSMSTSAAKELADLGYSNVLELDGGFNAWKAAGYEFLNQGP
jgi:rhodanese-related sulfurtransferase